MSNYGRGPQLKNKLFSIDQYEKIIGGLREQIEGLGYHQKKMLRGGRYRDLYEQLGGCLKNNFTSMHKHMCIKERLHQRCEGDFEGLQQCLANNPNSKECNPHLGEYFICIDTRIKQLLLSSTLNY